MTRCAVCRQDVNERTVSGRTILAPHFRKGSAPPCAGSNRTPREAEELAKSTNASPSLFDEL